MAKRNFGKAECPVPGCKSSPVTLTAEGVLRMHGPRDGRCTGSGQKPADSNGDLTTTLAELDLAKWEEHRETETAQALESIGGPPGHITVQWAEGTLLDGNAPQSDLNRAALVLMAGSLDKLSIGTRSALQTIRSVWFPPAPEDPAVTAQRRPGPNPYREPVPTEGPGQLEMGQARTPVAVNGDMAVELPGYNDQFEMGQERPALSSPASGVRALFADVHGVNVYLDNSAATFTPGDPLNCNCPAGCKCTTCRPCLLRAAEGGTNWTPVATTPDQNSTLFIAAPEPTTVPGLAPGAPLPVRVGPDDKTDFDQWKRYKIPDPITGKMTGRQRVTTFAKSISDQYGLGQWQQRVLLTGAARFPNMLAGAGKLDVKEDREILDQMVESIKNAAGAKDKAEHGTTVHTYTEHMDAGSMTAEAWAAIPQPFLPDLMAYRNEMSAAGLYSIPEMIERTTIHRGLEVAGTLDRILRTPAGDYVIGDVKTGQDLSYGWLDIAIQLACYAHGVNENGVWDWATRQWLPAPTVRTDYAIVMHAPAGQGNCTLYRVDLTKGWAAATLAKQVVETRKTRKGKDIAQLWVGRNPDVSGAPDPVPSMGTDLDPGPAPVFHVQPPTLPGLEPSGPHPAPAKYSEPSLDLLRTYAREAMWAAFQQNTNGQGTVWATAQQTFPPGDRIFDELIQIANGEPPF